MQKLVAKDFTGAKAWSALDIAQIEGATVRLHWTDAPYIWHVNDGPEVFVVLDGAVDMHTRTRGPTQGSEQGPAQGQVQEHAQGHVQQQGPTQAQGQERVFRLEVGDIFYAEAGDEHVAHPDGPSRVLVIEKAGSV